MKQLVLTDPARRALRTTYQAFGGLVVAMPVLVVGLQQLGADIFGVESKLYGRMILFGTAATVVTGAVSRFILYLEQHKIIPEWIKKQNTDLTVVVAEVKDGVVQDVTLAPDNTDEPGKHAAEESNG